jgi:hypothetical protein
MNHKALEDKDYEIIKAAMLDRDNTSLDPRQQEKLERVVSAAKILDRYPIRKHAVAMLQAKYPGLGLTAAYEDIKLAMRIFNSLHTFDYDWWRDWLINNIVEQIQASKAAGDLKSWAAGNANLMKAIGEKPIEELDPKLTEKHQFIILIQNNQKETTINLDTINKIPVSARKEITDSLITDINEAEAEEILNS